MKKRGVLALCMAVVIGMSSISIPESVSAGEIQREGNFGYAIKEDGTAELKYYYGTSKDIEIPRQLNGVTVTSIARCSFSERGMETVGIPETVTSIGEYAFEDCEDLKRVNIPEGVTVIESGVFMDCKSLESIKLPESVQIIESGAFSGCDKLQTISIPASVTKMEGAFDGSGLQEIHVAEENTVYASIDGVLYDKERTTLKLVPSKRSGEFIFPEGVTAVGTEAFATCENIEKIVVPEGVTELPFRAFDRCYGVKSISLPESLTVIKSYAFRYCKSLESISIPDSVTEIQGGTFDLCESLTEVNLPKGITEIPAGMFDGCTSLRNFVVPQTVTTVGSSAFEYCTALESVVLPENLTEIQNRVFRGCEQLHSVTIPKSVKKIGKMAFDECEMLTDIYYGGSEKAWKKIKKAKKNEALNKVFLLNKAKVSVELQEDELRYTGKKLKPAVVVRDKTGAVVAADSYKVSYKNNKKAGIATVTVKGDEIGTQTAHFRICPAPTKILKIIEKKNGSTVKWKKQPVQADGYEICYAEREDYVSASIGDRVVIDNRNKNSTFIKPKGKYEMLCWYAKIRTFKNAKINGKTVKVYSEWSDVK